jgi:hypothetical protein
MSHPPNTHLGCALHNREDEVRLIVVGHPLQDLRHALQAHACVDVLVRQRGQRPVRLPVALHEHQIVELNKAGVILQAGALVAPLRVEVVVQLAAGPARAGGASRPEVVLLAEALDALDRHANHIPPHSERLGVVLVDAHPHPLCRQPKLNCGELPCPPAGGRAGE